MKNPRWVQVKGNYVTPGGDALWACPVCRRKSSWHVYGVEHPYNHSHKCPVCGTRLLYPWENEDEVNKLKPCPFCGSENIVLGTYLGDVHDVRCVQCQATFVGNSEQECIEKWNKRNSQPMPQGIIDSLEKMAARMYDWLEMCSGCPADGYCGLEGSRAESEQCINAMAKAMARAAGWSV